MKITNQKPIDLTPFYSTKIVGDINPPEYIKNAIGTPITTSAFSAGSPVSITSNGVDVTDEEIAQHIINCCGDSIDLNEEDWCKELLGKCLLHFDQKCPLLINNLYAVQSATKEGLPAPSDTVRYTPAIDVIPTAKGFLAGIDSYDKFFASLAYYARPNTLGFYFANEAEFNSFKTFFNNITSTLSLPSDTALLCTEFMKTELKDLTESYILRATDMDGNDEQSFPRVLIYTLMEYTKTVSPALFGILPFTVGELFLPKSVVFVNVEKHAHATAKQVANEWKLINTSIAMPIKIVSNNKLNKLTGVARDMQKTAAAAAQIAQNLRNGDVERAKRVRFRRTAPTHMDITKMVKSILRHMTSAVKSDNVLKYAKSSYNKPNRRHPDDFNLPGRVVSEKCYPDIHIYADTSGSISEENYQDMMKACIIMAKKLNVNLYFNSFSHVMSECTKLKIKDKSTKQIYKEFQKLPKVTGGTDYEQIWEYINKSPKRTRELSLIITDFEFYPTTRFIPQPKNLYYAPCSHMNWNMLCRSAETFTRTMNSQYGNIRNKILM